MPFTIKNRRTSPANLHPDDAETIILDVTSRGPEPWVRFSPFYPHGEIPVPLWPGHVSASVEGIWQGLKVFESANVDLTKFNVRTMKDLKRTTRKFGRVLGHQANPEGTRLLSYREARYLIYLPAYRWVLENRLQAPLAELRQMAANRAVILLDHATNADVENLSSPLSHAGLIVRHLEHDWPSLE